MESDVIQPCDMGIIRNLKALYRKDVVTRLISRIDSGSSVTVSQLAEEINLQCTCSKLRGRM